MQVQSLIQIIRALNEAGVQYLIVGGVAVNAHGFERMTKDLDLVISLKQENILQGLKALSALGYQPRVPVPIENFADAEKREQWRKEKQMVVFQVWSDLHPRTPIDLFIYEPFDFDEEYSKAFEQELDSQTKAKMISLEGLVRMKKEAGRGRDLADLMDLKLIYGERFPES